MERKAPWYQTVSPSSTDTEYFAAAPAGFSLRLRPHDATLDPTPVTGSWCPDHHQLATLVNRDGAAAVFWVDAGVSFSMLWTDDEIREVLFMPRHEMVTVRHMKPFADISHQSIPCPIA